MNKTNGHLVETIIYFVLFFVCFPLAVVSCEYHLYEIMYMNVAGSLLSGGMGLNSLICFIKEAVSNVKKSGE